MPILDLTTVAAPDGSLWIGVELEADLDFPLGVGATLSLGLSMSPDMDIATSLGTATLDLGLDIDPDSILRIGAEANVFLEASLDLGLDQDPDALISLFQDFQGIFSLGLDLEVQDTYGEAEADELVLTVDIVPAIGFPANFQEYKVRFKVDSTEIPIRSFSVKASPNKIGTDVVVGLARLTDRSLLVASSLYTLDIGYVVSGVTTWHTVATGQITSSSYSIGWENSAPTDTVSLSSGSSLAQRINISPLTTIVIYDSSNLTLSSSDFEPIYDISGNAYPVELIPIAGCSLYSILGIMFARCGLEYSCNIPNFKIRRVDIGIGQSYFQTIGQLFGAFEPIILERDGVVHIIDSTLMSVPGFGTPKTITASKYKSLVTNQAFSDINGYIIDYVESANSWDSFDDEIISTSNSIEDIDENRITTINSDTYVRHYRRTSRPSLSVRDEVTKVITETFVTDPLFYGTDPKIINRTIERFRYDSLGNLLVRQKTEYARIPIWKPSTNPASSTGDGIWEYEFEEVRFEKDVATYADNIYRLGTQYRKTLTQIARAKLYVDPDLMYETKDTADVLDVDPDKEVPVDYKQEYVTAYRSGNLLDDGIVEYGPVMARIENIIPIDKDKARVETKEIDYLTNVIAVNVTEEQVGEISTSSQVSISRKAVFLGTGTRDSRRLESFNIGEIPIEYGLALAQRKFNRNNLANQELTIELIGVDLSIKRGTLTKVVGRSSEDLGNHLIQGYEIKGERLGTKDQIFMTQLTGVKT